MPAMRSLPAQPNLRYFKIEAKRRLRAGEFATLHEAQRAIAREHGLPSWPAFCRRVDEDRGAESRALPQVRWIISRFRDAGQPGWAAPAEAELREHFSDEFLAAIPAAELVAVISGIAVDLRQEFVVLAQTPVTARLRLAGREVYASAEAEPPHRLVELAAFPLGARITDSRITGTQAAAPAASGHAIPAAVSGIVEESVAFHGLAGLVLAGQAAGGPQWTAVTGWADLDRSEPMSAGHRFPAHLISMPVTAVAVLRLVADGKAGLDDPANDYLRTVTLADATVTIRELLSHTGGVSSPRNRFCAVVPGLAELCGPALACGARRGSFRLSLGGYAALGQLIADVTGPTYAEAVTRLVLDPLGMTASSFPGSSTSMAVPAVTGYGVSGDGTLVPVPAAVCAMPAAGGLWSTAADLVRFAAGWPALLPDGLVREALRPHARRGSGSGGTVGLGWLISRDGACTGIMGMGLGTTCSLLIRRADGYAQVALSNRAVPLEPVNKRVLDAMVTG
jgi:CubicO group peptidase (beta-lactamase class C family)